MYYMLCIYSITSWFYLFMCETNRTILSELVEYMHFVHYKLIII